MIEISRYRDKIKEAKEMPTISNFYGIVIKMYFLGKEHNPPHIHVIYGDETFSISIVDLKIIAGEKSPTIRVLSMIEEWIEIHKTELLEMWESQIIHRIEPLD